MRISNSTIDNNYELMPPGHYDGDIEGAELRDPQGDGSWVLLRLSMSNITSRSGGEARATFNSDITLRTDGVDIREIDAPTKDTPFVLKRASGLLGGLAEGIRLVQRDESGVDLDLSAFVDALVNGQFAGERVGFEVTHYKPKNTDKGPFEQFNVFGMAS